MPPEPVWVVGLPGCGVGRVAALLAAHPALRLLPELNLCMADTVGALELLFTRSQDRIGDGLLRAVAARLATAEDDAAIAAARDWLWRRGERPVAALYEELCRRPGEAGAVLPDTHLGWRAAYLARLAALPPARVLQLVRHPADWCRETVATLRQRSFVPVDYRDFANDPVGVIDPQIAWYRYNRNLQDSLAAGPHQSRVLRLESLCAAPQHTLDSLCDWLGLPRADFATLQSALDHRYLRRGPPAAPFGLELACMAQPQLSLDLRPAPAWPTHADWRRDRARTSPEVAALAAELGY